MINYHWIAVIALTAFVMAELVFVPTVLQEQQADANKGRTCFHISSNERSH
jgi:hypothetical protein